MADDTPNNITKLVVAFVTPIQELEDAIRQMLLGRAIDTAIGAQLDIIGRIVGQPRNGFEDEDYRRLCRARISVNRSNGLVNDVLKVVDLVIYDDVAELVLTREGDAAFTLRVDQAIVTNEVADLTVGFLRQTVAAGVRGILKTGTIAQSRRFAFDGAGPGLDDGAFIDARD